MRYSIICCLLISFFGTHSFSDLEPTSKEWKALEKKYLNEWNSLSSNEQMTLVSEVIQANNLPAAKVTVGILMDERTSEDVREFLKMKFSEISNPKALQWIAEEAIIKGNFKKKEKMRLINSLALFNKANEENKKVIENGLLKVVNTGPDEDKVVAIEALGLMKSTASVPTLIQQLNSRPKYWSISAAIIDAFVKIRARESVEPLIGCLETFTGRLQYDAERALEEITYQELGRDPKVWRSWWALNHDREFIRPQNKPMSSKVIKIDPTFYGMPIRSERIIFICDVSLSMRDAMRFAGASNQPKFIVTGGGKQVQVEDESWLDISKIKTKMDF
ncbi:MAG: HEAT repeat domain-containing protein, partial [Planctomycetota bacterium]